jgi:predicted small metal-binding protein
LPWRTAVARSLACRDVGMDCDEVIRGATEDEVVIRAAEHARLEHGMTEEQLSDPRMEQRIRSLIREA